MTSFLLAGRQLVPQDWTRELAQERAGECCSAAHHSAPDSPCLPACSCLPLELGGQLVYALCAVGGTPSSSARVLSWASSLLITSV